MKRLLIAATLLLLAVPAVAGPKFYEQATAFNRMVWKLDSLLTRSLDHYVITSPAIVATLDSLLSKLSEPAPVTVSDPIIMWDVSNHSTVSQATFPVMGVPVDGCRSILLCADWNGFSGRFVMKPTFSSSAGDTFTTSSIPIDSTTTMRNYVPVDSASVYQVGVNEAVSVPLSPGCGGVFSGYLHVRCQFYSTVALKSFRVYIVKEY